MAESISGVASLISEGDIIIYLCFAQLVSFEIDSISNKINRAEHEYMNMSSSLVVAMATLLVNMTWWILKFNLKIGHLSFHFLLNYLSIMTSS